MGFKPIDKRILFYYMENRMKPVNFRVVNSSERVICDNVRNVQVIDGVEYVFVRREGRASTHLMRKGALVKDETRQKVKWSMVLLV